MTVPVPMSPPLAVQALSPLTLSVQPPPMNFRRDSKVVSKTQLASTDEVDRKHGMDEAGAMDASGTLFGKRNRALVDAAENSEELLGNQEERCRVGDLPLALVSIKELVNWACFLMEPQVAATLECHTRLYGGGSGRSFLCADCRAM